MKLKVLGSGSSGNCYLLESDTECLILEAGLPFMEVKKALNFNIKKIVGVLVGHCHSDHSKYASEYQKAGIPVFKPYESEMKKHILTYGGFVIKSFDLIHDVPCFGFYIFHKDIGTFIYASDTEYIKWRFKNVSHILIEANYSTEFVDREKPNFEHVLRGHMNIETVCEFLRVSENAQLRNVILCHLSQHNSNVTDFIKKAEKVVNCSVFVAQKGLEVELGLPF